MVDIMYPIVMRECGECTMCCTMLDIPEVDSPAGSVCKNCSSGCDIYSTRPEACRSFNCLWKQQEQIPESLRPDLCGLLVEVPHKCDTYLGYVDRDDWNTLEIQTYIQKINQSGHSVAIKHGANMMFSLKEGHTRDEMHNDINNFIENNNGSR